MNGTKSKWIDQPVACLILGMSRVIPKYVLELAFSNSIANLNYQAIPNFIFVQLSTFHNPFLLFIYDCACLVYFLEKVSYRRCRHRIGNGD